MHLSGDVEVHEAVMPGLHRIAGNDRVPMQLIDRKSGVIDRRSDRCQPYILEPRLRTEAQAFEHHGDSAFHASAQRISCKIRQYHTLGIQGVARAAGEVRRVKVQETEGDIVAGKVAFPANTVVFDGAVASQIDAAERHFWGSERLANV